VAAGFEDRMNRYAARLENNPLRPADMEAEKQRRRESMQRAEVLVDAAAR
jgi:hypothetical protein